MKSLKHYSRQYRIWHNKQKQFFSLKKLTPLMLAILLSKEGMAQDKRLNDFCENDEFISLYHYFKYSLPIQIDIDADGDLDIFMTEKFYGNTYVLPPFIKNIGIKGLPNYEYDNYLRDSSNIVKVIGFENFSFEDSITITPYFFDFDHDGDIDILNREEYYANKNLKFYKNNIINDKPYFDTIPSLILEDLKFTTIVDLNGDKLEDLAYIDDYNSQLVYFPNNGNLAIPNFGNKTTIPLNFDINFRSKIYQLIDMDGDKLIDIAIIPRNFPTDVVYHKCISQNPLLFDNSPTSFYTTNQFKQIEETDLTYIYLLDFDLDGDIDINYFSTYQVSYERRKWNMHLLENLNTKSLNSITGHVNMDWNKNEIIDDYEGIVEDHDFGGNYYRNNILKFNLNPINYLQNKNINFETNDTIIRTPLNIKYYSSIHRKYYFQNPFLFKGFANSGYVKIYPDSLEGFTIVPPFYEYNFAADTNYFIDSLKFHLQPIIDEKNLSIDLTGFANRPGFEVYQNLTYQNKSALLDSGIIAFTPDSLYTFIESNPVPTSNSSGTYYWIIDSIDKFETRYIDIKLLLSADAEIGKTTKSTALFNSNFGIDRVPQNNYDTLIQFISGSYDPNDKIVTPVPDNRGIIEITDQPFEYTVRFQNTGNDTAFTVIITDTLEKDFDINTFKLLAASDPFVFDFKSGNVATWRFNQILLPPKETNEQGSNGFVKYSIKPLEGKGIGTEFTNTANIYFDFNKPIVTNETRNIFGVISGIQLHDNQPEINIKAYPNPVHDKLLIEINNPKKEDMIFRVYDINGTELFSKTINSNFFHFSTQDYAPAMYLYTIESANEFGKGKFVKE